jgi:hypothetical protein
LAGRRAALLAAALAGAALAAPHARGDEPAAPGDPFALSVLPDGNGGFVAWRADGFGPIRGVDLYRAVLRPDLVEAHESAVSTRRFLLIGGAAALVAGPAMGWVLGDAAGTPTDNCLGAAPNCHYPDSVIRENERLRVKGLAIGAAIGAAVAVPLLWVGFSIHPRTPSIDEARDLAEAWNRRGRAPAQPVPAATGWLRAELEPGGGRVALGVRF